MAERAPLPRWQRREGAVWLVLLGAWVPALDYLLSRHTRSQTIAIAGIALGSLAILSTVIFGVRLGFHREWRRMVLAATAGTVMLALLYSAALLAAPDPNGQNDHTAGIAVVILSAPTFVAVALMLCLGGAAGHAARWMVSRRKS